MEADTRTIRDILGQFATGVCVITTQTRDGSGLGMTANSFSSVSLDPALVLWSIQNNSECFAHFTECERYAINFLSCEQSELSSLYAQKGDHLLRPDHVVQSAAGTPLIRDALASIECRLWQPYPGGDHTILVGEIKGIYPGAQEEPLIFSRGKYRSLATA